VSQTHYLTEKDSKTKLRPLLIKAGCLLAPTYFEQALDGILTSDFPISISPDKDEGSRKGSSRTRVQVGPPKDDSKTKKQQETSVTKPEQSTGGVEASKTFVLLDSLHPDLADQLTEKAAMLTRYQATWKNAQYYVIVVSGRNVTGETK